MGITSSIIATIISVIAGVLPTQYKCLGCIYDQMNYERAQTQELILNTEKSPPLPLAS